MAEHDWLAAQFEANRTHLRAVAYRMLGSLGEADDAVWACLPPRAFGLRFHRLVLRARSLDG
jgi:hypothetical protein